MLHIPCIPNRRVNVRNMDLIRACQYPFCDRVTTRYHEIVSGKIKLFDRQRHERQKKPMMAANERHLLQETRMSPVDSEPPSVRRRQDIKQREYVRLRITAQDFAEDTFGAADHIKPIMDNGDPHGDLPVLDLACFRGLRALFDLRHPAQSKSKILLNCAENCADRKRRPQSAHTRDGGGDAGPAWRSALQSRSDT
jgi:hypothetical protein